MSKIAKFEKLWKIIKISLAEASCRRPEHCMDGTCDVQADFLMFFFILGPFWDSRSFPNGSKVVPKFVPEPIPGRFRSRSRVGSILDGFVLDSGHNFGGTSTEFSTSVVLWWIVWPATGGRGWLCFSYRRRLRRVTAPPV